MLETNSANISPDQDKQLQLLVKDQVRSQFDEQWTAKRTFIVDNTKIILPIITIILAALGIMQFFTIENMRKDAASVKAIKDELQDVTTSVKREISDTQSELSSSKDLSEKVKTLSEKISEQAVKSSEFVFNSQNSLSKTQETLYQAATSASNAALAIVGKTSEVNKALEKMQQATNQVQSLEQTAKAANESANEAKDNAHKAELFSSNAAEKAKTAIQEIETKKNDLGVTAGKIDNLEKVNKTLIRVQSTETFILKGKQSLVLTLYYPDENARPIPYKFAFNLKTDIKKEGTILWWKVQKGTDAETEEKPLPLSGYNKGSDVKKLEYSLADTHFVLELELLNVARFAPNFIILKIRSKESNDKTQVS